MTPSSTSTSTVVITRTHTAAYLADAILGSISELLAHLGIPTANGSWNQARDERAISTWIREESLTMVILECHRPNGAVDPVFEFPLRYSSEVIDDAAFVIHSTSLAKYRAKISTVPVGTTFQLFCTFRKARTPQPGWSPGTRASTEGLQSSSFGSIASGPGAAAALRYLHGRK